jgi:hypothetical protein
MSQQPHAPTEKDRLAVETMAGHGITQMDIARVIGVSLSTLTKWYRDELETGAVKANSKVAQSLFDKACGNANGSVAAAIFWLKCRARWSEATSAEAYVGKKAQLEQAAKNAGGADSVWAGDLETEIRAN